MHVQAKQEKVTKNVHHGHSYR